MIRPSAKSRAKARRVAAEWAASKAVAWEERFGRCDACHLRIFSIEDAHAHHKLSRRFGVHTVENLALLHPACHEFCHRER